MNQANTTIDNVLFSAAFAVLVGAALFGALAAPAIAEEGGGAWTNRYSWNWNIGNHGDQIKGSGVVKEESRAVANFSRLTLAFPAIVTLTQGAAESLTISADDNLLPLIVTRVAGDQLVIEGTGTKGFSSKNEIRIRLTVKSLSAIAIKGSGDVIGDQLKSDKLDITIAGSGDVKFKSIRADQFRIEIKGSGDVVVDALESKSVETAILGDGDIKLPSLKATQVKISIRGSGDVSAAGTTDTVNIEITGDGDVNTRGLIAREAGVKIMASGDVKVHAKEKLVASVTGSGDIRYAGTPANVSKSVRGSGTIEPMREK